MDEKNGAFLMTAYDVVSAGMVEAILQDNDIPFLKKYRHGGFQVQIVTGNTFNGIDIFVPPAALERAQDLIACII